MARLDGLMRALAAFIVRGPVQAIVVTVVLALIPFISNFSGSVVALVALQVGALQGLLVTAGSALAVGALILLSPVPAVVGVPLILFKVLTEWLPAWLLAVVLRASRSLALTMQTGAVLGSVSVVGVFLLEGDPTAAWVAWLARMRSMLAHLSTVVGGDQAYTAVKAAAPYMTGLAAGLVILSVIVVVLVGRGAQAALIRPGALRTEFNELRLGRAMAGVTVLVVAVATVSKVLLLSNLAIVLLMMYPLYGLAVIHGALARSGANVGWLIALYAIIFLAMPPALLALVVVGLLDSWLDFRARIPQR